MGQPCPSHTPPDRADRVWAAGYAASIKHRCPGFDVNDAAVARLHGAATTTGPDGTPTLDDTMLPVFKSGALAAQQDFASDTTFCTAPATHAKRAANWVRQFVEIRTRQP